jgi:glycosyltransferase involved in cell wall biosynthesis
VQKLAILCNESAGRIDAIRDHSFRLAQAIRQHGVAADVCQRSGDGAWYVADGDSAADRPRSRDLCIGFADYDALVLQYNPFMYGKWGFAPWLPLRLLNVRRARPRTRIALMVHEPYVPMVSWQWALMGAWQRAQLEAVRLNSDVVFASIEAWARMLANRRPYRSALHLPVGSNLPDRRDARGEMRRRLKVADDDVVLASLSTSPAGRLLGYVVGAANALATKEKPGSVALLHLGAGAPKAEGLIESVRVYQPGRLSDEQLASWLSAADLFLAPFVDGVSTRRGSMMAALQHALPVIGTAGRLTDSVLAGSTDALRLLPVGQGDLFSEAVAELAHSREHANKLGLAGRALYESRFDWPVVADRLLRALDLASEPS